MQNSKVIQILRVFSPEEFRGFEKFIASPFFARGRNVMPLYKYLKKFYPDFSSPKMTAEDAFGKIYRGKKFSLQVIRNLLSAMQKMCEEYLITRSFESKIKQRNIILLEELRKKKLYSFYDTHLKESEKDYVFGGNIDIDLFMELSAMEAEKIYNYMQRTDYDKYFDSYIANVEYMIMTVLLGMFETIPNLIALSKAYDLTASDTLIEKLDRAINYDSLLDDLKKSSNKYYEIIAVYYYLYKAFKYPAEGLFYFNCRDQVFRNFAVFSRKQVFGFLQLLESYCINRVHENKEEYVEEVWKLYRFMFEIDVFTHSEQDFIAGGLFRNIILKTVLPGIDWTEKFVGRYLVKLPPEVRESMKYFWESKKNFIKKDFSKVIECALKIKYDIYGLKMDVKQMYLASYYELGYFEEARSMIDSYIKYLNLNKEVVNVYREGHLNYIAVYKKLLKLKEVPDNKILQNLKKGILETKTLANRQWLLEKAEELSALVK